MARNQETLQIKQEDGWTNLSNGAVSSLTFQVLKGEVYIRFTEQNQRPAADDLGQLWSMPQGVIKELIANLVYDGAASRYVWVRHANSKPATVYVDHA